MYPLNEILTMQTFECSVELPQTIGAYTLEARLNQADPIQVYRAFHEGYARGVMLELIDCGRIGQDKKSVLIHAGNWLRARHPNLRRPIDTGEYGDFLFLAFELTPGGTLGAGLQKSRKRGIVLPSSQILHLASYIGSALIYLHDRGQIHGSLSPAAISVGLDGTWMLGDLEPCFLDIPAPVPDGTLDYYQSPEHETSLAGDVYSLAVILSEMLLNLPPRIAVRTIAESNYSNTPGLHIFPRALISTLKEALRQDPAVRMPTIKPLLASVQRTLHAQRQR